LQFLALAIGFLTRLPVPQVRDFEPAMLTRAALYFPLVGVLVGAINVLVWRAALTWLPAPVAVGIAIAVSLLVTGAFHEDGFADACDGFGGGTTPQQILEIMKDSRIGAFGAVGVCMLLALKWTTLSAIPRAEFALLVISAHMFSRFGACALIVALRYVREGESKARPLADALGVTDWLLSAIIGCAAILAWLAAAAAWPAPASWRALGAAAVAAGLITVAAGAYFQRRIGGYTGDCLGAAQQLAELCFLLAALGALRAAGAQA
jgi:adenosylcobinamide-GDP ribazoletransferase